MNDEPNLDPDRIADESDPLDDTQPIDVRRFAPTPDPRPDDHWAWASPGSAQAGAQPEPVSGATYSTGNREPTAPGTSPWSPPVSAGPAAVMPPPSFASPASSGPVRRRGSAGVGTVVAAALLSAVLASGGTVLLLDQTGALDQRSPAASSTAGNGQQAGSQQPVSIDESSAVIDAAAKVGPAVVKITVAGQSSDPFGNVPTEGVGSGFIYDASGWILTNRHVVTDAETLVVELKDGRRFDGRVYGIDTLTDLAIVKVDASGLPTAPVGKSDGLKIGQLVIAIGSPLGTYSFSVTSGIVSGKGRDIQVDDGTRISNLIQTDAAINRGNSGGPLVDASGSVIGVNTAVATDSSGIGFAIPIDIARPIMEQALRGEALSRPWIGIRFESINLQVKEDRALTVDNGALVTNSGGTEAAVVTGSPASKAGIQDGDIILAINGIRIDLEHPLNVLLVQFSPNDTVELDILRAGTSVKVNITLGTRPGGL